MPTMMVLRVMVVLSLAMLTSANWDFTHTERYQTWVSDLKPGFMIQKRLMGGQGCYCKVPWESSSSSSVGPDFSNSFDPSGSLTSSGSSSSSFDYHFLSSSRMERNITY